MRRRRSTRREVDFQPVPEQVWKRLPQGEPWLGLVVSVPERLHLANVLLEVPPPTVNDLARCWPMP